MKDIIRHVFRPRIFIYAGILALITLAAAWSIATRLPLKVDVIRDRATLAREVEDEQIENVFTLRLMNTTEQTRNYHLSASGLDTLKLATAADISVPPATTKSLSVSLRARNDIGRKGSNPIFFDIVDVADPQVHLHEKAAFIMP